MSKKIVIAGSASLKEKVLYWKEFWENQNFDVIGFPFPIGKENFLEKYSKVHTEFFQSIIESDVLFIINEDKNGIVGYIGAETFAEMCFGVVQNLIYNKNIEIILLQMPDKGVQSYEEVDMWLKLGWIKLYKKII